MIARLVLIVGLALAGCAGPEGGQVTELRPGEIQPYADFVEKHTGYSVYPLPPVKVDGEKLKPYINANLLPSIGGIYLIKDRAIYFANSFSLANPIIASSLVHELVHHGQWTELARLQAARDTAGLEAFKKKSGYIETCGRSLEREAYRIQHLWLSQNGPSVFVDYSVVEWASRC